MRFSPSLLDEIRARLPVSAVVARRVRLKRQGREYVGLSPFKPEKTPSFTVNDQKGFYHCFASGEHGDIFTFVMKTEGLSFPEAVERLAAEAGVPMPVATPQEEARKADRDRLLRLMETACAFFEAALQAPGGREALDYLRGRGLSSETIAQFRLGYAPPSRSMLKQHMAEKGFSVEEMAAAGMVIGGEGITVPYDRFRNRIIFPISDLRGRIIAFGGRALDPEQPAKYLNSPDTPLFHKGTVLFNAANARRAAHDRGEIIVAEGYMDVIALTSAGFPHAVAPLGTALTEQQLKLLWRMADEPILCFDGDAAGQRAAFRAVETALPHLQPGKSLRFVFLPDNLDPDDLIRERGATAMAHALGSAQPLVDVLWLKEVSGERWATPERRAALERRLTALADTIGDAMVRNYYRRELRDRVFRLFREREVRGGVKPWQPRRTAGRSIHGPGQEQSQNRSALSARHWRAPGTFPAASTSLLTSSLISGSERGAPRREALIVTTLIDHPWLLDEYAEEIASLSLEYAPARDVLDTLLRVHAESNPLDKNMLRHQLITMGSGDPLTRLEGVVARGCDANFRPDAPKEDVVRGWKHIVALHRKMAELKRELEMAELAFSQEQSEENFLRLRALHLELEDASVITSEVEN